MDDAQPLSAIPTRPSRTLALAFGCFAAATLPLAWAAGENVTWAVGMVLLGTVGLLSGPPQPRADEAAPLPPAPEPVPVPIATESPLAVNAAFGSAGPVELSALVQRLFEAAEAPAPAAVHVWVEDEASQSLRLLGAAGPLRPGPRPCQLHDDPVGASCIARAPRTAPMATIRLGDDDNVLWRVAVPLDDAEPRAVVAVDILGAACPDPSAVRRLVDGFRLPLRAAVSLRLAAVETSAARALFDALSLLDTAQSRAEVVELALEGAMALASAATGSIMLSGDDRSLRIAASRGLPEGFLGSRMREGEGVAGWVAMTRTPLLIEDHPDRKSRPRPSTGPASISVPLLSGECLVGVLNVGWRDYPARPVGPTLDALGMLGRRVGSLLGPETSPRSAA